MYLALIAGFLGGTVVCCWAGWYLVVKPLVDDIRLMRRLGFQPNFPREEPPKQPEVEFPNEGLY